MPGHRAGLLVSHASGKKQLLKQGESISISTDGQSLSRLGGRPGDKWVEMGDPVPWGDACSLEGLQGSDTGVPPPTSSEYLEKGHRLSSYRNHGAQPTN